MNNGHYTQKDNGLLEKIIEKMTAGDIRQSFLAKRTKIPTATISLVLNGKYGAPPEDILNRLWDTISNMEAPDTAPACVETAMFKLVVSAGNKARRDKTITIVTGNVGTGKTTAIKNGWIFSRPLIVESNPHMHADVFLTALMVEIGLDPKGATHSKMYAVINALKGTDSLLIVDEAEHLKPKVLETIRRIHDIAEIGVMLVGNEKLKRMIVDAGAGVFAQMRSRCGLVPATVDRINDKDSRLIVETYLPEAPEPAKAKLIDLAQGSARMLRKNLITNTKNWMSNNPGEVLTAKIVSGIAKAGTQLV